MTRPPVVSSAVAVGVALALAGALAGCDPTPAPTATATPTPSASTTASPDPTPEPAAEITIPGCEDLLSLADARAFFGDATEFFGEVSLSGSGFMVGSDPAGAAASASDPYRGCSWGVPNSDGAFWLYVGVLEPAETAALETGLTDAGFSSVAMGTVTGYDGTGMTDVNEIAATHLITGRVWIACESPSESTSGQVAAAALDALRSANPSAGL